jgi:hypothetical protein
MTLQPIPYEFPYEENFLFYQVLSADRACPAEAG